jgi:virulence factor BrkB
LGCATRPRRDHGGDQSHPRRRPLARRRSPADGRGRRRHCVSALPSVRDKRWASAGSLLVIAVWIIASLLFKFWASDVADFTSAVGNLTVLLFLSWYVFVSSAIFLVGAQVDELPRKRSQRPDASRLLVVLHGRGGRS